MKAWKPRVGQRVKVSDEGYRRLQLDSREAIEAATDLRITYVENVGNAAEPIWVVEVDNPHVNRFVLESTMFEPIKGS